jgi:oligopeptide transport system substrate-binding protein
MFAEPPHNARSRVMAPSKSCLSILLAAALLRLAGCRESNDDALNVTVIGTAPPTIADPSDGALSLPQQVLMQNVAQGLVRFDARGQIEPGLAERWNVSDDGLSYVFRLTAEKWPDGRSVSARDIARLLSRQLRPASRNPAKDGLGAVEEVVAMTDRVIEIRLIAPRPNLLQLLAQPEFALTRERLGTGPFHPENRPKPRGAIALLHVEQVIDGPDLRERVDLSSSPATRAIATFVQGGIDLVLGGTFADLPTARRAKLSRAALRFDPVAGLFGLVPARRSGPIAKPALRNLLNQALDRDALVAALQVPGLVPRATLLQSGLESLAPPPPPAWTTEPILQRRQRLFAEAQAMTDGDGPITIAIALPDGDGAAILFDLLAADWGSIGIKLVRADRSTPADLKLIDAVAPSASPAWFVRTFRCSAVPICSTEADEAMDSARAATVAAQRAAFFQDAARLIEEQSLFIPLAAPIRWSLVGSRARGFAENVTARHPLSGLGQTLSREGQ